MEIVSAVGLTLINLTQFPICRIPFQPSRLVAGSFYLVYFVTQKDATSATTSATAFWCRKQSGSLLVYFSQLFLLLSNPGMQELDRNHFITTNDISTRLAWNSIQFHSYEISHNIVYTFNLVFHSRICKNFKTRVFSLQIQIFSPCRCKQQCKNFHFISFHIYIKNFSSRIKVKRNIYELQLGFQSNQQWDLQQSVRIMDRFRNWLLLFNWIFRLNKCIGTGGRWDCPKKGNHMK